MTIIIFVLMTVLACLICDIYVVLAEHEREDKRTRADYFKLGRRIDRVVRRISEDETQLDKVERAQVVMKSNVKLLLNDLNERESKELIGVSSNEELDKRAKVLESLIIDANSQSIPKKVLDSLKQTNEIKVVSNDDTPLHDSHYKKLGIEPWDILKANMTFEEYKGFLKGNIQKYLHRNKEGLKDYEKLANYANKLISEVKEHGNNRTNNNG